MTVSAVLIFAGVVQAALDVASEPKREAIEEAARADDHNRIRLFCVISA